MPLDPARKPNLIQEYLDGSLSSEQVPEAEQILQNDAVACTVHEDQDKLATFVSRLQEALAMPPFPSEQNDQANEAVRKAISEKMKQQSNIDETAGFRSQRPFAFYRSR